MPAERTAQPDVIFDVVFEEGLLFFELMNNATVPATKVITEFRRPVLAPDGRDLAKLQIFQKTEFLAPGKVLRVFVDSVAGYFARRQPDFVHVVLTWHQAGKERTTAISHDVRIYRNLPYVTGSGAAARRGVALTDELNRPTRR